MAMYTIGIYFASQFYEPHGNHSAAKIKRRLRGRLVSETDALRARWAVRAANEEWPGNVEPHSCIFES